MGDDTSKKVPEIFSKYFGFLLTCVTITVGIWQYKKTEETAFRKEFYYKQAEYYSKVIDQASILVSDQKNDKEVLQAEFNDFRKLEKSAYLLYTTDTVQFWVTSFDYYFNHYLLNDPLATAERLHVVLQKLVNTCRYSLRATIKVDLKDIDIIITQKLK